MLDKLKSFKLTQKNFIPVVLGILSVIILITNAIAFGIWFGLLYTVIVVVLTVGGVFLFSKIMNTLPKE